MVLLVFHFIVGCPQHFSGSCPAGSERYLNSCYYIGTNIMTHTQAKVIIYYMVLVYNSYCALFPLKTIAEYSRSRMNTE